MTRMELIHAVLEHADVKNSDRLVLLAMASRVNKHHCVALKVETICRLTRLGDAQVRRSVQSLVAQRYLIVIEKGGGKAKAARHRVMARPAPIIDRLEPSIPYHLL